MVDETIDSSTRTSTPRKTAGNPRKKAHSDTPSSRLCNSGRSRRKRQGQKGKEQNAKARCTWILPLPNLRVHLELRKSWPSIVILVRPRPQPQLHLRHVAPGEIFAASTITRRFRWPLASISRATSSPLKLREHAALGRGLMRKRRRAKKKEGLPPPVMVLG